MIGFIFGMGCVLGQGCQIVLHHCNPHIGKPAAMAAPIEAPLALAISPDCTAFLAPAPNARLWR